MMSRNDPLGLAARTRKNLAFIEDAFEHGADVHVVSQLGLSLLGLVVIPWERKVPGEVQKLSLSDLAAMEWPSWDVIMGSVETLGDLLRRLRNAVAHGHIAFSSESRFLDHVHVHVWNRPKAEDTPSWYATMHAPKVKVFCYCLLDLLEEFERA